MVNMDFKNILKVRVCDDVCVAARAWVWVGRCVARSVGESVLRFAEPGIAYRCVFSSSAAEPKSGAGVGGGGRWATPNTGGRKPSAAPDSIGNLFRGSGGGDGGVEVSGEPHGDHTTGDECSGGLHELLLGLQPGPQRTDAQRPRVAHVLHRPRLSVTRGMEAWAPPPDPTFQPTSEHSSLRKKRNLSKRPQIGGQFQVHKHLTPPPPQCASRSLLCNGVRPSAVRW